MPLCTLSTGDIVYRYYKCVVVSFIGARKVLSTSVLNGGYHEDLTAVFNNDCNPGDGLACTLKAPTYEEHLKLIAEELGLAENSVSGISTTADMKNMVICQKSYERLTVTALVTGGIEVNGGRVGDPAQYYEPKGTPHYRPGTINIILIIDGNMPQGILARALVTCTEAKVAALQELLAGSNYSTGIATGSGTDSSIIIANAESSLYFTSAGKHDKLGELIGVVVKKAVKEALAKQTGLSPKQQHSMLRRMKRFGITEELIWQKYHSIDKLRGKAEVLDCLYKLDTNNDLVTPASLYVHLLDQYKWELISEVELEGGCADIRRIICQRYKVALLGQTKVVEATAIHKVLDLWIYLICEILHSNCFDEQQIEVV